MVFYIYKIKMTPLTASLTRDAQKMHAALCEMAGCTRADGNILWNYDQDYGYLRAQSDYPLSVRDGFELVGTLNLDRQQEKYVNGSKIHFQLTTDFHKKRAGRQVYITDLAEAEQKIRAQLGRNGLDVECVRFTQKRNIYFTHSQSFGGPASITVWDLDVYGTIIDSNAFWAAWHRGIGQHRAYGNGLFVLKS